MMNFLTGTSSLLLGILAVVVLVWYGRERHKGGNHTSISVSNRRRKGTDAYTPPRSLSAEKRNDGIPHFALDGYKDTLPPSSREKLVTLLPETLAPLSEIEIRKNLAPFTVDFRMCGPSTCTPTGVSLGEVAQLGDFPNYAELSDVPQPSAYEHFKIESALPRPYRPFRWPYYQTMSLTRLETDWWLELDKNYASTIQQRLGLYKEHGKAVLDYLPGSELATKEIMEIALQFYSTRYPQYFSLTRDPGKGYIFHNAILKSETVIKDHHPLHVLLENIPEDFALMLRNPLDGYYYLRAGVICSALGWNLGTKIGLPLREVHGPVPDYKEKMEFSMDRYFAKLPSSKPIQRGSWGLEIGHPLWHPADDAFSHIRQTQDPNLSVSDVHLRVDWQTLRRLPLSGAVAFNFKALFTPIEHFKKEPYVPTLVKRVLLQGKPEIMQYKGTWPVEHVVLPALEKWEKEQMEQGVMNKDWKVGTLDESPFFPGWEEQWHVEQGF